jgi:hypothetical protein
MDREDLLQGAVLKAVSTPKFFIERRRVIKR